MSYDLYRLNNNTTGNACTDGARILVASDLGALSYLDTGLTDGIPYRYCVQAKDSVTPTANTANSQSNHNTPTAAPTSQQTDYYLTKNTGTLIYTGAEHERDRVRDRGDDQPGGLDDLPGERALRAAEFAGVRLEHEQHRPLGGGLERGVPERGGVLQAHGRVGGAHRHDERDGNHAGVPGLDQRRGCPDLPGGGERHGDAHGVHQLWADHEHHVGGDCQLDADDRGDGLGVGARGVAPRTPGALVGHVGDDEHQRPDGDRQLRRDDPAASADHRDDPGGHDGAGVRGQQLGDHGVGRGDRRRGDRELERGDGRLPLEPGALQGVRDHERDAADGARRCSPP